MRSKRSVVGMMLLIAMLTILLPTGVASEAVWTVTDGAMVIASDEEMQQWMEIDAQRRVEYAKTTEELILGAAVTAVPRGAFRNFGAMRTLVLSEGLERIGNWAFSGCDSLERLDIPQSVTAIGMSAFEGCTALSSVNIPDSVTVLDSGAFDGCGALRELRLPSGIDELSCRVLADTGIESLMVPENVLWIDDGAVSSGSLRRLVVAGESVRFLEYRLLKDCQNLEQLVFLGGPPVIDMEFLIGTRATPTVYYLRENMALWVSDGEQEWNGCPLLAIDALQDLPEQEPERSFAQQYGWEMRNEGSTAATVDIYCNAGWKLFCRMQWPVKGQQIILHPGVTEMVIDPEMVDWIDRLAISETVERLTIPDGFQLYTVEVSEENRYVHMEEEKLIETRSGRVLWEAPGRPHPTAYLGEPLTEEEIAARQAEAAAYREAATRPEPTATPAPEPAATAGPEPAATPTPVLTPLSTPAPTPEPTATTAPAPLPVSARPGQGAGAPAGPDPVILLLAGIALAAVALAVVIAARYRRRK